MSKIFKGEVKDIIDKEITEIKKLLKDEKDKSVIAKLKAKISECHDIKKLIDAYKG
jgi:hypothetical protein